MCGIIFSNNQKDIYKIKHRGIHINTKEVYCNYHLQHVSLPIQTDENDYYQPIYIEKHNCYILYNGEIFNYDYNKFNSDLELIKYYFENINYLNLNSIKDIFRRIIEHDGFFSFLIYTSRGDIYSFTDLLGKKQLYYNISNGNLKISSELKIFDNLEFDNLYISSYIKFGYYFIDDRTIFRNVKRIIPGKLYYFTFNKRKMGTYSGPIILESIDTYEYFKNRKIFSNDIYNLIHSSVESRYKTIRDYPIGILLSGGLDSSIILYHINKICKNKDNISIITIENDEDEKYANLMVEFFGSNNHFKIQRNEEKEFTEYMNSLYVNESPQDLGSVYSNYKMFEKISKINTINGKIRVVFSGDGADELFGGYRRNEFYRAQESDTFNELTYYHLPRLDKLSMYFTLELRCPFLSHDLITYALNLEDDKVKFKKILKEAYKKFIPEEIINRSKVPLKSNIIRYISDEISFRRSQVKIFKTSIIIQNSDFPNNISKI